MYTVHCCGLNFERLPSPSNTTLAPGYGTQPGVGGLFVSMTSVGCVCWSAALFVADLQTRTMQAVAVDCNPSCSDCAHNARSGRTCLRRRPAGQRVYICHLLGNWVQGTLWGMHLELLLHSPSTHALFTFPLTAQSVLAPASLPYLTCTLPHLIVLLTKCL